MEVGEVILRVGEALDVLGVIAIVLGIAVAIVDALLRTVRRIRPVYTRFRRVLGRGILLGLEILVAADIIRTVAVTPTLESVTVLALIVVIRTFLSWTLGLEITGRWPWQQGGSENEADVTSGAPPAPEGAAAPTSSPTSASAATSAAGRSG